MSYSANKHDHIPQTRLIIQTCSLTMMTNVQAGTNMKNYLEDFIMLR